MTDLSAWLAIEDLFMFGLGLDIGSGLVLTAGLLASDQQLVATSRSYFDLSPPVAFAQIKDRIRAKTGIILLMIGFTFQAAAYTVLVGRGAITEPGWRRAVAGLAILGLATLVAWPVDRVVLRQRLKPNLVSLAQATDPGTHPLSLTLRLLGEQRWPGLDDETDEAYCSRVFGTIP